MLNPRNTRLWITALRSGEHVQTRGILESLSDARRCCLGVACRVAIADGLPVVANREERIGHVTFDSMGSVLPPSVVRWLFSEQPTYACEAENPRVVIPPSLAGRVSADSHDGRIALTALNDRLCASFEEIADALEATLAAEAAA